MSPRSRRSFDGEVGEFADEDRLVAQVLGPAIRQNVVLAHRVAGEDLLALVVCRPDDGEDALDLEAEFLRQRRRVVGVAGHVERQQHRRRQSPVLVPLVVGEVAPALDQLQRDHGARLLVGRALFRHRHRVGALQEQRPFAVVVQRPPLEEGAEVLIRRGPGDEPLRETVWVRDTATSSAPSVPPASSGRSAPSSRLVPRQADGGRHVEVHAVVIDGAAAGLPVGLEIVARAALAADRVVQRRERVFGIDVDAIGEYRP